MNKLKRREIYRRLAANNPKPTTELEYKSPFELLVSVILSAQATDNDSTVHLSDSAQKNLRMLLDVELDLAISFGSTDLPLRDVLKLASGSIVELNRNAADPVDVLVNDRVIARGEVVVVDGNYGIRITEIVSRQERIRTVF